MKYCLLICAFFISMMANADRLKDISSVEGVRDNQLFGYGLVIGLNGTGDNSNFTDQSFTGMLAQFGIVMPEGINANSQNVAAVSLTATLPPFSKPGQKIDITASSIGSASSLQGGTLLLSTLKGADGQVYAIAQGNLVVGGLGSQGNDGSRTSLNIPTVGRIPNGASVERTVPNSFNRGDTLTFNLNRPDFTTAKQVSDSINALLGPGVAKTLDATSIRVSAPRDPSQRVTFLSILENLEVELGEERAKIVINSRTGTIIIGQHVKVSPAAVTHGSLTVTIKAQAAPAVQGEPLTGGETIYAPRQEIAVNEDSGHMFLFGPGASLNDIVRAVNQVGAAPGDVMAILEGLKQAGAINADLVVI
ncbi:flagellar P-ring protein FlgI [Marinomonas sp. SBI22]|jgi:flagellar P-ring protein precursor FlgI|uniref:flagellar basal body P-ring protein FlgI n=1 Tax=unclassified Marinomonas TaxID=196814 RepID=UPI0005FA49B1|nr:MULTISPECIES: flagellar basal body P-ring protein FlgI [unclassified Marinomonas]KJZ14661.1 flagellar P-ring protein FlgI [Marinomonas sp. S3726]KZM40976.1 flagellar P-ring protein FlgI [Marinomonas sp. SBI22]KZM42817.1 flagellar P-ring protein FlgI [Marinomonas sp. SBI8L]